MSAFRDKYPLGITDIIFALETRWPDKIEQNESLDVVFSCRFDGFNFNSAEEVLPTASLKTFLYRYNDDGSLDYCFDPGSRSFKQATVEALQLLPGLTLLPPVLKFRTAVCIETPGKYRVNFTACLKNSCVKTCEKNITVNGPRQSLVLRFTN
jgi:hypothetical protein